MTDFDDKIQEITNLDEAIGTLSHEDLCEITQSSIKRLIASDPLLSDLPVDVTPEEVKHSTLEFNLKINFNIFV